MFKKVFSVLLVFVLSIAPISATALASEKELKNDTENNKVIDIDLNDLSTLEGLEGLESIEVTTYADIISVGKPIKYQAKVPNYYLKTIIDNYGVKSNLMAVLSSVLFYKGVTAPAGLIAGLVVPISNGGIDSIKYAYARGQDMYLVQVYASGKAPSLSTISYRFFSKTPIRFVE